MALSMSVAVAASLSALAASSMAAARKETSTETKKAMAPKIAVEYLILRVSRGFWLEGKDYTRKV